MNWVPNKKIFDGKQRNAMCLTRSWVSTTQDSEPNGRGRGKRVRSFPPPQTAKEVGAQLGAPSKIRSHLRPRKQCDPDTTMAKRKSKQTGATTIQTQLEKLPLLKKPLEKVGLQVNVPGLFWEGSMTAEEKQTLYQCTVRDFTAMHTFFGGRKSQAFQMQEMGALGTGSLEHGDASGEIFWMPYPMPFLEYYYATYPDEKPEAAPERTGLRKAKEIVEIADDSPAKFSPDVHPDFPNLRLGMAPVFRYFTINSDVMQDCGPKSGQFAAEFECVIKGINGAPCCRKRTLYHKRGRAVSTSNLILHCREKSSMCANHAEALKEIELASKNFVDLDGESVAVFNFSESFPYAPNHLKPFAALAMLAIATDENVAYWLI